MTKTKRDSRTANFPAWARWRPNELVVAVHVQPGARKSAIRGEHGERLKITVRAPPVEGKANEELLQLLASQLALRPSALRLLAGAASREKTVAIDGDEDNARHLVEQLRALGAGAN